MQSQKEVSMDVTDRKQLSDAAPLLLRQDAVVSVSGYFYAVDFGPDIQPQHRRVGKDRRYTCSLGADCPEVIAAAPDELQKQANFHYLYVQPSRERNMVGHGGSVKPSRERES